MDIGSALTDPGEAQSPFLNTFASCKHDFSTEVRSRGKAFAAIDGDHYACFTHNDQFLAAMRQHVFAGEVTLPVALVPSATGSPQPACLS